MTAGEWYVFDGASQRGPMSHADVVQFLKDFTDRDAVSVWRPGLDDWKPASRMFEIVVPTRFLTASKEISSKRRYSLYGMYVGVSVMLADYLFEWRGSRFEPWTASGIAGNIDRMAATMAASVVPAFIIGGIVDFVTGRSRRKSVLDPSTFEEPEIIPEIPLEPNRRQNFIARYWRGEYSLGISFWWFGFIGNVAVLFLIAGIVALSRTDRGYDPLAIFISFICAWLVITAFIAWQATGVWRSANRLVARRQAVGKRAGWATVAKVVVLFSLVSSLSTFVTSEWSQLVEISRMAFLDDPDIPAYSIRVMRNGTEAEITGGFKYGLTDDFNKILKASRQIKVVHLDSGGGRIGEAIRLNGVLRSHGMDTYVSNGCYSACTIAFAAGHKRFIRNGAILGFHGPAFPGMTTSELQSASLDSKELFIGAGFDERFVDKALSTPSSDMWKPSAELLAAAGVITGLSEGTDFAVSGFGADISEDRMAKAVAGALPLLQALKDKFPEDYDGIISIYYDDYIAGKTEAEAAMRSRAEMRSIIWALQPLADDAVLADMAAVFADRSAALGAKSPALCYRYISGIGAKGTVAEHLPASLINRQSEIDRRVIETARDRQDVSATVVSDLWKRFGTQLATKGVGNDQVKLLTSGIVDPSRYGEYCQTSATFYREIARLPLGEAGTMMRSILAHK